MVIMMVMVMLIFDYLVHSYFLIHRNDNHNHRVYYCQGNVETTISSQGKIFGMSICGVREGGGLLDGGQGL